MEVICTPSNGSLAMLVDMDAGKIVREVPMPQEMRHLKNRPFGISRDTKGRWYIANDNIIAYLTADLVSTYMHKGLFGDIHQIAYDHITRKLWVVATSIDSLLAIDTDDHTVHRFCLLTDQWVPLNAPGKDTHHFNSITWYEDRFYIVAHRFGQGSAFVRTYDRRMRRTSLWQAGIAAHNVMEYNGQLVLLDSQGGRIVGSQGLDIKVCEPEQYTRGMVISPDGIVIVAVFKFGNRDTRTSGNAYLRAFELASGKQIQEVLLPDTGNIQDMQWWDYG